MQTFLKYYQQRIQPQVAAIDVFLKTEDAPYAIETVAALLLISPEEGRALLAAEKVSLITKGIFFRLLQMGSSPLCGMFRRMLSCGLPQQYTPAQIAYIFALPLADVERAAEGMGESLFSEKMLPQLFGRIFISDKQYQQ